MDALDLSLPLSTLLRTGTARAHEGAENTQGAGLLTRGELDKEEYVRFLMMLWHVYNALESCLERHSTHPTLQPTYNPALLARAPSLACDISFLLQVPESSWRAHPIHKSLLSPIPKPLDDYVLYLQQLSNSADPSPLLAHAYVRYLGDLSGGQIIRHRVLKAYGLDAGDQSGVMFYDFKVLGGSKSATVGDMKKIKDWYREGMNHGAGDNQELKSILVQEANKAFDYNNRIFSLLRAPTKEANGQTSISTPLGDSESKTTTGGFPAVNPEDRTYLFMVPIVLTVCLASFYGGFRVSKDYLALEQWVTGLFYAIPS